MPSPHWTVYLLRCADGSLYAGIARDLADRVAAHNAGRGAKYTRARLPVAVAWSRGRQPPTDARRLEYALKQLSRAEKLRLVERRRGPLAAGAARHAGRRVSGCVAGSDSANSAPR
jgi:putative endonuclease